MKGVLLTAVFCLVIGLGVLFEFCHGATGFQFAYPLSGASVHLDITTTGIPAVIGLAFTGLGVFLLGIATLLALIGMRQAARDRGPLKRRENSFEE